MRTVWPGLLTVAALAAALLPVRAAGSQPVITVCPTCRLTDLRAAVGIAPAGAVVEVLGGTYPGPVVIDRPLTLVGRDRPVIDGGGQGSVVAVTAPGVRLEGFVIRGSGLSHDHEDSGVVVSASGVAVVNNEILDCLFGIYYQNAPDGLIEGNTVVGKDLPEPLRGDGLKVWYSPGARVIGNRLENTRDALVWYSDNTLVRGNRLSRGRYGLHFMYSQQSLIEGNDIRGNSVGIYLMYGAHQTVRGNIIRDNRGPSGYGLALKETDRVVAEGNLFYNNRVGLYIDNSPLSPDLENRFTGNWVAYNDTGLLFTAATRRNVFSGNVILENLEQVGVQGGGALGDIRWADRGRGNFWGDYVGYDADGDGVGDIPYRNEPVFGALSDRYPVLTFFRFSPGFAALELAARAVPVFRPQPRLTDPAPLVAPPAPPPIPGLKPDPTPYYPLASLLLGASLLILAAPWLKGVTRGGTRPAPSPPPIPAGALPVQVTDLTKAYDDRVVLENVSFTVRAGEAVALWGPNGAGKTTILRCLLGLTGYHGEVRVGGYSPRTDAARLRRLVGYVPQQVPALEMPVGELVEVVAALRGEPAQRARDRLAAFGLGGSVGAMPVRALSGGMQQKLILTLALIGDPPILLLDEPTANLDPESRAELLGYLRDLRDRGRTILFTSHRADEVRRLADRVVRLEGGRKVGEITLAPAGPARVTVRLVLEEGRAGEAATLLRTHGFEVYPNGRSLRVRVDPGQKAEPFLILGRAGVRVEDFALEEEHGLG